MNLRTITITLLSRSMRDFQVLYNDLMERSCSALITSITDREHERLEYCQNISYQENTGEAAFSNLGASYDSFGLQ